MGPIDFTDSIYDAQQGSQSAIQFIYDNTIPMFYKEACALMRDKYEADIAIRDAYVFIFDHLDSLEDSSRFLLWANEVCKNTCISKLKQRGVFNEIIPAEAVNLGEILPATEYDPLVNMNASMSADHVQVCLEAILDSLPDNQRICAVLWGEGYPIRSIARKLSLSPAAVNYTLAYALGNITNSVTTLGDNGLPLYSMEPIPYFLWLLMNYYRYYEPTELIPGIEASFPNILRVLMPEEGSVYTGGYNETPPSRASEEEPVYGEGYSETPPVQASEEVPHSAETESVEETRVYKTEFTSALKEGAGGAFAGLDITDFLSFSPEEIPEAEEDLEIPDPLPEMDVYQPHEESDSIFDHTVLRSPVSGTPSEEAPESTSGDHSEGSGDGSGSSEAKLAEAGDGSESSEEVPSDSGENSESSAAKPADSVEDAESSAASGDEPFEEPDWDEMTSLKGTEGGSSVNLTESGGQERTLVPEPEEKEKKKGKKGLWIALIIIMAVIILGAAAIIFSGNYLKEKINALFGSEIFKLTETAVWEEETTMEPATQAETKEPATQAETKEQATKEPATQAETKEETRPAAEKETKAETEKETEPATEKETQPETVKETEPAPQETQAETEEIAQEPAQTFNVVISADGMALGMHTGPDVETDTLLYIPSDTEVVIDDVVDDWGHTWYDGTEGWIWLGYTANID